MSVLEYMQNNPWMTLALALCMLGAVCAIAEAIIAACRGKK